MSLLRWLLGGSPPSGWDGCRMCDGGLLEAVVSEFRMINGGGGTKSCYLDP